MKASILVELDAILDTRLGTILKMGSHTVSDLLDKGYKERTSDDLSLLDPSIDGAEFKRQYASRDVETLKLSRCTNAIAIVKELLQVIEQKAIYAPTFDEIELHVNIYPYKLNEAEREMMVHSIKYMVAHNAKVVLTEYSLRDLTPRHISDSYEGVVFYNFDEWLTLQGENLKDTKMPMVTVFAPALLAKKPPSDDVFKVSGVDVPVDPFGELEYILSGHMNLSMQDATYFSLVDI